MTSTSNRIRTVGAVVAVVVACSDSGDSRGRADRPAEAARGAALTLASSSFSRDGEIPVRHTCEGDDLSPPLAWSGLPAGTETLGIIVDDPDAPDPAAPKVTWVHWVLYDVPATANGLPEGPASLPDGTREGLNSWRHTGYRGPCPPIGRHRYFHKLYALDVALGDLSTPSKAALLRAMEGHVLGGVEIVGTYQKQTR